MKALFVINTISRYAYFDSIIRHLCDRGHSVVLLSDLLHLPGGSDQAAATAASELTSLSTGTSRRRKRLRKLIFGLREIRSYASYLNRSGQDPFYLSRQYGYLPRIVKKIIALAPVVNRIIASAVTRRTIAFLERLIPPDRGIADHIRSIGPDVVVASPALMRFSEEIEYIKAAKSLGIPTAIPIFSWDSLTTKGLIQIVPDVTLVWNDAQAAEAQSIHGIPEEKIEVTGSPFMDKWFEQPSQPLSEPDFRNSVGLDANSRFVLYLGSTVNIARDESWLALELAEQLRETHGGRVQILVRPHGAHQSVFEKLRHPGIVVWTRDELLPDSPQAFAAFAASIAYATAIVGINTTGMVDAVVAGKPVITAQIGEYRHTNASKAVHYRQIVDSGIYEIANTEAECVELIGRLLDGHDDKAEARRSFVERFIRPMGTKTPAGEVAAETIERAAQGQQ